MIENVYKNNFFAKVSNSLNVRIPKVYERRLLPFAMRIISALYKSRVDTYIQKLLLPEQFPIFSRIEIETINRCNLTCSFCPTNKHLDTRPFKLMEERLFFSIIEQLQDLDYAGLLALFSNNEPLLDNRIIDFSRIAKQSLPKAFLYLYTNGTLLELDKFIKLMEHIDLLLINNYSPALTLIKPVQEVYDYCMKNKVYQDKVRIRLRKMSDTLTTRASQAKNRTKIRPLTISCLLPFTQMVIRPDGKVSLCCADALGKVTLGDVTKDRIIDIWRSDTYKEIRGLILNGRRNIPLCSGCDYISLLIKDIWYERLYYEEVYGYIKHRK